MHTLVLQPHAASPMSHLKKGRTDDSPRKSNRVFPLY